jgi:hypothetical protein
MSAHILDAGSTAVTLKCVASCHFQENSYLQEILETGT